MEKYQWKATSQPVSRVILGSADTQAACNVKESSALHQSASPCLEVVLGGQAETGAH